jgi:hypothetical protein
MDQEQQYREQIMRIMDKLKLVCIEDGIDPAAAVVALIRMAGFMTMVTSTMEGEEMVLNKQAFFDHVVNELNEAYDGAVAARETRKIMVNLAGEPNE